MPSLMTSLGIERLSGAERLRLATELLRSVPPQTGPSSADAQRAFLKLFHSESTTPDVPPHTWFPRIRDLLALSGLEEDWDGQGAEALPAERVEEAIKVALDLIAQGVPPADRVIAGVNGSILFEWHRPAGYLELEITGAGQVEGRVVWKGTDTTEAFLLPTPVAPR